uniref:Uncharacterized protein n=1 Tax=Lactuca sativa TaxID=4236 RepID=A0A9R1UF34_LACSA|nr:hypothetical protein LSAT_V11C900490040 [Lactuca sativa]
MFNDVGISSMTYSECVNFFEHLMHEDYDVEYGAFIFYAYGTDGIISIYMDHIGFDNEDNDDDDGHESCIDGENYGNINELRNVDFEFNEGVMHMNSTSNDPFLGKLCVDEEEDNNIVDDDDGREF